MISEDCIALTVLCQNVLIKERESPKLEAHALSDFDPFKKGYDFFIPKLS